MIIARAQSSGFASATTEQDSEGSPESSLGVYFHRTASQSEIKCGWALVKNMQDFPPNNHPKMTRDDVCWYLPSYVIHSRCSSEFRNQILLMD